MKIYIGTGLENWKAHNDLRDMLYKQGHTLTYDWTEHGPVWMHGEAVCGRVADDEINGVIDADCVIILLPGGRGTHLELGAALALRKPTIIYGDLSFFKFQPGLCAFYYHPRLLRANDLATLFTYLRTIK